MWVAAKHISDYIPDETDELKVLAAKTVNLKPFIYHGPLCSSIQTVQVVCEKPLIIDEKHPFILYCF